MNSRYRPPCRPSRASRMDAAARLKPYVRSRTSRMVESSARNLREERRSLPFPEGARSRRTKGVQWSRAVATLTIRATISAPSAAQSEIRCGERPGGERWQRRYSGGRAENSRRRRPIVSMGGRQVIGAPRRRTIAFRRGRAAGERLFDLARCESQERSRKAYHFTVAQGRTAGVVNSEKIKNFADRKRGEVLITA